MNKEIFYQEFKALEDLFEATDPVLAETLNDPETGVEGYVVVWNTDICAGGPFTGQGQRAGMGKGGTRITPTVSLDEVKMLAKTMALKNAAAGLPLGGAKSGMRADPDAPDFETQYRSFVRLCEPHLYEGGGVFGGFGFDIGARPDHPHWAIDELGTDRCFTGKPVHMGGTDYDVEGIAGLGVATAGKVALEFDNKPVAGASFAVQGAGAMGGAVIRYFSEYGGVLKCLADPRFGGTFHFAQGAPQELIKSLASGDFERSQELLASGGYEHTDDAADVLYTDIDILFPCAVQYVVTEENYGRIGAAYISEGANNPITDDARTKLHEKGITIIPDFIANPGGIIAAFVELTSDVTPEENVKTRAKVTASKEMTVDRITGNVNALLKLARDLDIETAHAGKYIALKRIINQSEC